MQRFQKHPPFEFKVGAVLMLVNFDFIIIAIGTVFKILAYFAFSDELPSEA